MFYSILGKQKARKIYYTLNSGKNSKLAYYVPGMSRLLVPGWLLRRIYSRKLARIHRKGISKDILDRIDYYCKLDGNSVYDRKAWREKSVMLKDQKMTGQKVYFIDSMRYARRFSSTKRWILEPGDVYYKLELPSITKARPIGDDNYCSVLMKLNLVRHFIFVKDEKDFADKKNMVIFRGGLPPNPEANRRHAFVSQFFGHPMCDVGVVRPGYPQWYAEKLTIKEHLDYKFIMTLEGNDVASNLKWVMSSNSIAVMPRPKVESWFMEGKLIPNYHYIEVKPDFSDLEERLTYYINHPDEARAIVRHAHEHIEQFKDKKRESLISMLVLEKYFNATESRRD